MASRRQRVPNLLTWSTYSDLKYGLHEIEYQIAPDAEVDPNIDEHVAFAGGCEDPKVLEQDGELDEEDHKAVDNG